MKKQVLVLFLCSLGYTMSLMSRSSPAVLSDSLIRDLAFTSTNLGLVSAATMLSYGFMQVPAGMLADAFGPRKSLIFFTLIAGIATLAFAFSQSPAQAIIARFFVGIGVSLSVISITMLSIWFTPKTFARANGVMCALSEFGPVLAASPLVLLIAQITWRGAMFVMGIIILLLTFCWIFLIPSKMPQHKNDDSSVSFKKSMHGLGIVIKHKPFWAMCIWQMAATGSVYMLLNLWWVPYLVDTAGYTVLEASYIISMSALVLIGIQVAVGFLSDIVFKSRKVVLVILSISYLIAALMLVFGTGKLNYAMNVVLGIMILATVAGSNICNTMVKENFPPHLTGTALGFFNMFYPLWTAASQMLFGMILTFAAAEGMDVFASYRMACTLVLGSAIIALGASLVAKDTYAVSHN